MRQSIGVYPPPALEAHASLFAALAAVYPIHFLAVSPEKWPALGGVILLEADPAIQERANNLDLPCFTVARCMIPGSTLADPTATDGRVHFADSPLLDRPLRTQSLNDLAAATAMPLTPQPADTILATGPSGPLWIHRPGQSPHPATAGPEGGGWTDLVVCPPSELAPAETLRDHLRGGRWLGLLPLVHFLRRVSAPLTPALPPLRAAFLFDDPNLHWPTYGYLNYDALANHATAHGYHVSIATIPMDGWLTHPRAVAIFHAHPQCLSLTIHGNDHAHHELAQPRSAADCEAILAQALRRTAALARRTGLAVSPIMVPPHERATEPMIRAMLRLGLEGMTLTRPFSWCAQPPMGYRLADWGPAEPVLGGLPILVRANLRHALTSVRHRDDLVLRAFLGQPLILYGHHEDLADGLEILEEAAGLVASLGEAHWMPLAELARTNYWTATDGERLRVRLFTRRARIAIPEGIERLTIERAPAWGGLDPLRLQCDGKESAPEMILAEGCVKIAVKGPGMLDLELAHPLAPGLAGLREPRRRIRPYLRRFFMEGRDRLRPIWRSG